MTQAIVVFDLASLRFRFSPNRRSITVLSQQDEQLAVANLPPNVSDAEAAHTGLRTLMRHTRLMRLNPFTEQMSGHRVGLYNPHSTQVAYVHGDQELVFNPPGPFSFNVNGQSGIVNVDNEDPHMTLRDTAGDDIALTTHTQTPTGLTRVLAVYR